MQPPHLPTHTAAIGALLLGTAGCATPAVEGPAPTPCTDCTLEDGQNFTYSADLEIEVVRLMPQVDARVDWSGLGTDMHGHPIDPVADVDQALIAVFYDQTADEVAAALAADTAQQSDVALFVMCQSEAASCLLSEFSILGSTFDPAEYLVEGPGTWLIALTSAHEPGALTLAIVVADGDATGDELLLDDGSATLTVDVDLDTAETLAVPANTPEIRVDWSELTKDALGNDLETYTIDELWISGYTEPVDTLQDHVFDLEDMAHTIWKAPVGGLESFDLAELGGETPFTGVDAEGTWLLALWCTACTHPAPRFMTVLTAVQEG